MSPRAAGSAAQVRALQVGPFEVRAVRARAPVCYACLRANTPARVSTTDGCVAARINVKVHEGCYQKHRQETPALSLGSTLSHDASSVRPRCEVDSGFPSGRLAILLAMNARG